MKQKAELKAEESKVCAGVMCWKELVQHWHLLNKCRKQCTHTWVQSVQGGFRRCIFHVFFSSGFYHRDKSMSDMMVRTFGLDPSAYSPSWAINEHCHGVSSNINVSRWGSYTGKRLMMAWKHTGGGKRKTWLALKMLNGECNKELKYTIRAVNLGLTTLR